MTRKVRWLLTLREQCIVVDKLSLHFLMLLQRKFQFFTWILMDNSKLQTVFQSIADQKGPAEEKYTKLKGIYSKLREEHIQLLRTVCWWRLKKKGWVPQKNQTPTKFDLLVYHLHVTTENLSMSQAIHYVWTYEALFILQWSALWKVLHVN